MSLRRIPIGIGVAGLYYLVGGLSAVNGGSTAMAQAEGIMVVGVLLGLLIVFFGDEPLALPAAALLHVLLLGWCAIQ